LTSDAGKTAGEENRDQFLNAIAKHRGKHGNNYIEVIQRLLPSVSRVGTQWLDSPVDLICRQARKSLPALNMFGKYRAKLA
jgi:hypothetical protein